MSASDKIEEAKNCFQDIKQSGRNNYQKYDYFELRDILPIVRKICRKFKLKTQINTDLERQCFVLTITDREDNSCEEFVVPYASIGAGDAGKWMQDFGRCQTYARRYLYLQAFEIAVPDEIDCAQKNRSNKPHFVPKPESENKYIRPKSEDNGTKKAPTTDVKGTKNVPKKASREVEEVVITDDEVKEALDNVYEYIVENKGEENFTVASAIFTLNKLYMGNHELISACKKALKVYTADKVKQ